MNARRHAGVEAGATQHCTARQELEGSTAPIFTPEHCTSLQVTVMGCKEEIARPHLGVRALLGPPHDGVLGHDVIVVQDADDVREQLQQLAVLIAAHL